MGQPGTKTGSKCAIASSLTIKSCTCTYSCTLLSSCCTFIFYIIREVGKDDDPSKYAILVGY